MDAIFVVDQDYDSFHDAWDDLHRLLPLTGPLQNVTISPFRFTLSSAILEKNPGAPFLKPSEMGYHFAGTLNDEFLNSIQNQTTHLIQNRIPFQIRCHSKGTPLGLEVRFEPPKPPYVVIPIEDATANLPRFLGFYASRFGKAYQYPESKMKEVTEAFFQHCLAHPNQELPFTFDGGKKYLWFGKSGEKHVWIPRYVTVGRHPLFKEIHIHEVPQNLKALTLLLGQLELVKDNPVYFQFFISDQKKIELQVPTKFAFETTYLYHSLNLKDVQTLKEQMSRQEGVLDTFTVFEQPKAQIGQTCHATYMLRKTPSRGYEIRLQLSWDNDIDAENAVAPFEEKAKVTLARIV